MGRTYESRKKGAKDFDVNYSGADALGIIMHFIGHHNEELEADNASYGLKLFEDRFPSTTFSATKEKCLEIAKAVRAISQEQEKELYKTLFIKYHLMEGTPKDLHYFLNEWATFLEKCEGYKVS